MEVEGGCYCGSLRYKTDSTALFKGMCFCRECQYISGGGANYVLGVSEANFSYTKGGAKGFTRSDLDNPVTREFCPDCGTQLISRAPGMPGAVMLKVGTLDDPGVFEAPQMAIYTIDKQAFHQIPEGIPTFERMPG